MACTRCRRLKKGCKQIGEQRCERCCQTDQVCQYLDVANDPRAPRPRGSSPHTTVPESPTSSPQSSSEPLPAFELYQASSDQSDGEQYAPHILRNRTSINSVLPNAPSSSLNLNVHAALPPDFLSSQNGGQSSPLLDTFPDQTQFDTTVVHGHENGIYDYRDPCGQPLTPFIPNNVPPENDLPDPPHSPQYLPSQSDPSPLSQNNLRVFTSIAMSPDYQTHYCASSPSLSVDVAYTSNNATIKVSPDHSPISLFEDPSSCLSNYDLPCSYCFSGPCKLHSPQFSYRCESSTDEKIY